jgi:hypothetical protein
VLTPVAVEKLHFLQSSKNLGDRKCLGKPRKSFVGHPDTILFSRISLERVFQQPQAFTPTTIPRELAPRRVLSVIAKLRQLIGKSLDGNTRRSGQDPIAAEVIGTRCKRIVEDYWDFRGCCR